MKKFTVTMIALALMCTGCSKQSDTDGSKISYVVRAYHSLRARMTGGKAEFAEMLKAKSAARNWKMRTEMRLHPGAVLVTVAEVSCPSAQHLTGSLGDEPRYEEYRTGTTSLFRSIQDKEWTKNGIDSKSFPCGEQTGTSAPWAMMNEGRDVATAMASIVRDGKATVTPAEYVEIEGQRCQEWQMSFSHPGEAQKKPSGMIYTLCINPKTHLPVEVRMGNGGVLTRYYDWNVPVQISAPSGPIAASAVPASESKK